MKLIALFTRKLIRSHIMSRIIPTAKDPTQKTYTPNVEVNQKINTPVTTATRERENNRYEKRNKPYKKGND